MQSSTRFCDSCGAINRADARFCYACGQPQLTYASTATGLLTTSHTLKQRYSILDKIGQGGFGAVYKVEDMLFQNALRAVKEMGMRGLSPQETQEAIAAFKNEAVLLANLSHPNLPHIYDHFEGHGRWYLVMDYVEGETLEKRLEQAPGGKLSIEQVLEIGLQLCSVLNYLHNHQPPIIFRDLKPDNVMLGDDNHLCLIDFGIARFFKPGQAKDTVSLGTPGYASPEQYGRMQTSAASDIYSLGATLHHLISGINPGLTPFLFQPLELDQATSGNAALDTLIMSMVELKVEKRPTSTESIREELQHIQQMRQNQQASYKRLARRIPPPPPASIEPTIPLEPQQILVVAQEGDGQYTTIGEALQHAQSNAFILVRPGMYQESLQLDKEVTIIGNGAKEDIILENCESHTIEMQTSQATIRGLTIRCLANASNQIYHALAIVQGQLLIEDCDFTSHAGTCVTIQGENTNPTLRYCTLHDSFGHGILVSKDAWGTFERCDIFASSQAAVCIARGGNPMFRHCTLHDNQQEGIIVEEGGQGTFEDCTIYNNGASGAIVSAQSNPLLLRCQIHHNQRHGITIQDRGQGSFQECAIHANGTDNVLIASGSTPYFYHCTIFESSQSGVLIKDQGLGTLEYCDIYRNQLANISITTGGNPRITHCTIHEGKRSGIAISASGQGHIEQCTFRENAEKALAITPGCEVTLKANHIEEAKSAS
ncbi:pectinesterase family protein [Ktedonobacter robiniae]|uniref:Protein kinase domain-containing protein n=1 Tax=Ktedonobacter robiniae TaxID=2778365 RepID=A0ABQ3V0H0_9CHLR|nr:pectinesterase family protein [Ktedonobacter robiniae]GHO58639.1 hypothetical protein KSB_71140 [Ktedonobacter robiniae]